MAGVGALAARLLARSSGPMTRPDSEPRLPGAEQTASSHRAAGRHLPVASRPAHRRTTACPRTGAVRSPISPRSLPPADTLPLPLTKHQADFAIACRAGRGLARAEPVQIEADIGPAGAFRRHMLHTPVLALGLSQKSRHRVYSLDGRSDVSPPSAGNMIT